MVADTTAALHTFEKYFSKSGKFIADILAWKPDYIVPVAKKGGKLLKIASSRFKIDLGQVRYKSYFELNEAHLRGKRIAVIDDATQYTATLLDYRRFFESKEAFVRTYSLVGHQDLKTGLRWKYDEQAEICSFLQEPVYQEYILQQAIYLADQSSHFDLDHVIFRFPLENNQFDLLLDKLRKLGLILPTSSLHPQDRVHRFSLDSLTFDTDPKYFRDRSVTTGPIRKIKFLYDKQRETLSFSPMVFPTWQHHISYLDKSSFQEVPFKLPFATPQRIDPKNEALLNRMYQNLYFIYVAAIAKSFIQQLAVPQELLAHCQILHSDLNAFIGPDNASVVTSSMLAYVTGNQYEQFLPPQRLRLESTGGTSYDSFGKVYDSLKKAYETKIKRAKNRVGVHHFISYEHLFNAYNDAIELSSELDYHCDYGAIVPETVIQNDFISRACRTGEPNIDLSWERTQVLIPMAIIQIKKESGRNPEAMLLNKVLSNFVYDFPAHSHSQLHCLIGKPFNFGTLVHVSHRHRANSQPSIYINDRNQISPYYAWRKRKGHFEEINSKEVISEIARLFAEEQETPYSEIVNYFRFLTKVWQTHGSVDILNMLSLCREQNHFYAHVRWNIVQWIENFAGYIERRSRLPTAMALEGDLRGLHQCGLQSASASEKLRLSATFPERLDSLVAEFGFDLDFMKAVERVKKNTFKFTDDFRETQNKLREIVTIQRIATNAALLVDNPKRDYLVALTSNLPRTEVAAAGFEKFAALGDRVLKLRGSKSGRWKEELGSFADIQMALRESYEKIIIQYDTLPKPTTLGEGRIRGETRERAKNLLTHLIYSNCLDSVTLLFLDLSGLRTVEEPKEDTVAEFYLLVDHAIEERGGKRLSGGKGGDDEYSILFKTPEIALAFARDVKSGFASNLFLLQLDVKFGLAYVRFSGAKKEEEAIRGWGVAKDCGTLKTPLRNRGHLVVSKVTLDNITTDFPSLSSNFIAISGSDEYFYHKGIEPLARSGK